MTDDDGADARLLGEAKRMVAKRGADPQTHFDLAVAYSEMGLVTDAIAEFEAVLKEQPTHQEARARLARERSKLANGQG